AHARKRSRRTEKHYAGDCRRYQKKCDGSLCAGRSKQSDAARQSYRHDRHRTPDARPMGEGIAMTGDAKPWGIFATLALGAIALVISQLSGVAALIAWYGLEISNIATMAQHGGAIMLFIAVSAPVQVAMLALASSAKGNVAEYLGYKLPSRGELVFSIVVLALMISA